MTVLSFTRVMALASAVVLISVPALAQRVDVDYDRSTNFSTFKTYQIESVSMPGDSNPLMTDRIVRAVDGQMSFLGFKKVDSNPDLRISIRGDTHEELVYTTWGDPYGWGPQPYWGGVGYPFWWSGGFSGVDVERVLVGTLTLDMTDTRRDKVVLHGTAVDRLSSKSRKNENKMNKAVIEIFEESPWGSDFDRD